MKLFTNKHPQAMKSTASSLPLLATALLLALAPFARAQTPVAGAPPTIDYQGQVLDANGAVLAPTTPTNYTMQFRIYNQQTGGTIVWAESQVVTVDKGAFSVRLGLGVPIPAVGGGNEGTTTDLRASFNEKDRFLGVTVQIPGQAPAEIIPRLAFLSSPFAFVAERAKSADSVVQTSGNSSLGNTTVASLTSIGAITGSGAALTDLNGANIAPGSVDVSKLAAAVAQSLCPPGTISAYGGATAPPGWFLCDGAAVSRSTYPALFATIGLNYGNGGGNATLFSVPDLRGMFLRGMSGTQGTSRDPDVATRTSLNGGASGNNLGSNQGFAFQFSSHGHGFQDNYLGAQQPPVRPPGHGPLNFGAAPPGPYGVDGSVIVPYGNLALYAVGSGVFDTQIGTSTETRPRNIYVNYIIKQ